ncbi:MAG: hypothetical protein AAGD05_18290, partial [Bacteroidota bacterium]
MTDKELLIRSQNETSLKSWREQEKTALELLKIVGDLRFDRSIEIILFRRNIYDARPSKVLDDHLYAAHYISQPIAVHTTLALVQAIARMTDLGPARIDVGHWASEWLNEAQPPIDAFVHQK